tara:strand:- start:11 stop:403 length:393 start_codon:yes stop_codon:yes gene_type:complete
MNKGFFILFTLFFAVSCSDNESINKGPSFGYPPDREARVNEGVIEIGTYLATDIEGDGISYSISNVDMNITNEGVVTFNILPDFEEKDVHEAIITASNDNGSDEINLTVFINDSDCEFDTAATFDECRFH